MRALDQLLAKTDDIPLRHLDVGNLRTLPMPCVRQPRRVQLHMTHSG